MAGATPMTDEQLIEAMARRLAKDDGANWEAAHFGETPSGETPEEMRDYYRGLATAALAKVDEVYHRIPKDQEPDAWVKPNWQDPANYDGTSPVTVYPRADWTPLYALEKRP